MAVGSALGIAALLLAVGVTAGHASAVHAPSPLSSLPEQEEECDAYQDQASRSGLQKLFETARIR